MIFFYIDESGTSLGRKSQQTNYFVLATISIDASDHQIVDEKINQFKRDVIPWAKPEDWEIKGRELLRGDGFFKSFNKPQRNKYIRKLAQLIIELPCYIIAVHIDKRILSQQIGNDEMYRIALWKLIELIEQQLSIQNKYGMLMIDSRSDMRTSIQDRRLIDAYRDWIIHQQSQKTKIVQIPWFGFSAFYVGLQLSDFVAYLINYLENDSVSLNKKDPIMVQSGNIIKGKLILERIP